MNYHDTRIALFVNPKTQFLVKKLDISPQLSRAISGLQCGSIQNSPDCRSLLNFLQDGAENDEIQLKKYALRRFLADYDIS